jgi:hypothetical protein
MKSGRGQVIVIVAVLVPVALLFLAVAVDAGRLYIETARLERALQAGADAGMSLAAEQLVTLVVARQTAMAGTPTPDSPHLRTPLPSPDDLYAWLTDGDRATLVSPANKSAVEAEALAYAARNGIDASDPEILEITLIYPQSGFDPHNSDIPSLRLEMSARRRATILLAGLLGREFTELSGEAMSELRIR